MRHNTPSVPASLLQPLHTVATKPQEAWDRDIQLTQICRDATYHTLKPLEPEILAVCEACLQHNFMSSDNQRKLEAGLLRALNVIATLDRISSDEVVAPPPPQRRHVPPPRMPDKPTMPNVPKARLTSEEEAKGRDLLNRIAAQRDRYMKEKLEYDAMERDLEDDLAEAEEKRRTLQKYFEKVNQEVAVARSGLDTVKDSQLIEMRGYIKPPDMVRKVLEAVLVVLNEPEANNWETMQHYIRQPDFIPSVRAVQDINGLPPTSLRRIKEITLDPQFTTENARRASHACAPLVQWTHAMMHYYDISSNAKGLKEELERLDNEIAARQSELANGGRRLRLLDDDIKRMQHDYDENYGPSAVARLNDKARHEATVVYRAAVADWRAKCNVLKEKHRAQIAEMERLAGGHSSRSPPPPPRPLLTRTVQVVEETRGRCQRLVDAIEATMAQLKKQSNVLVVEKRVYPKPVARPVSAAARRSFRQQSAGAAAGQGSSRGGAVVPGARQAWVGAGGRREQMLLKPVSSSAAAAADAEAAAAAKRKRTPHLAPWRQGSKYTFEKSSRVKLPDKSEEEKLAAEKDQAATAAAAAASSSADQQSQQGMWGQPQQQQQYDPYGGQQQQQPMWGAPQQQQQQYDPYGGQQQQQQPLYADPYGGQQQQQQWGQPQQQYNAYGGGGGGGGGGFTFM